MNHTLTSAHIHAHTDCDCVLTGMSELRDQRRPPWKQAKESKGFKICRLKSTFHCCILAQNFLNTVLKGIEM